MSSQHFRAGFLRALAENGLSPTDFVSMVEKKAEGDGGTTFINNGGSMLSSLGNLAFVWPAALAGGAGYFVGSALGGQYHNLTKAPSGPTIEDLKNEELINKIKQKSVLLKRKNSKKD